MGEKLKNLRVMSGIVFKDKMNSSIVVKLERQVKHPIYPKYIKRSTKLHVHDPKKESKIGDLVLIRECRPISRTKRWELVEITKRVE